MNNQKVCWIVNQSNTIIVNFFAYYLLLITHHCLLKEGEKKNGFAKINTGTD
jgi:hypothetical protein